MKKLIVILTVLIGTTTFSQGIDLGVKGGVNYATITDASGLSNRTGFLGGVFLGIKFNDKIAIQGEVLYSQQGAEFDAGKIDLDYVNVPIIIKYYLVQGLNIQLGPQFGFLMNDKDERFPDELFNNAGLNDADISGVAGIGYDFPFGINVEGRYNLGFSDIGKENVNKNSVVSLAVGYSFL